MFDKYNKQCVCQFLDTTKQFVPTFVTRPSQAYSPRNMTPLSGSCSRLRETVLVHVQGTTINVLQVDLEVLYTRVSLNAIQWPEKAIT